MAVRGLDRGWVQLWLAGANSLAASVWGARALAKEGARRDARFALPVLAAAGVMGIGYLWRDPGGWPALAIYAAAGWWVWRRG